MRIRAEEEANNFTLLRLLLALAVVFGHFQILAGIGDPPFPFNLADAAVDCFFVVSGFLIALSYSRAEGTASFYVRRFFRLYPLYSCVVLIQAAILLALLPHGPLSEPNQTIRYLVVNLVFANFLQTDIGHVLSGLQVETINPSLWTLKIELGFYFLVPLIFAGIRKFGRGFLVVVFIASACYQILALQLGDERMAKQLPGQLQFFVVGMALYLYARNYRLPTWISATVAVLFLAIWTWMHPIAAVICPLLTGAFVYSVALCMPVIRIRTDMSYGVYLLHGPIVQMFLLLGLLKRSWLWLTVVVVTVSVMAFVTEHLIERPGNEFGRRLSRRLSTGQPVIVVPVDSKATV